MTRLAALLALLLLVACNSGPLQWTDTEQWAHTSRVVSCVGLPAGMCSTLTQRIEGFERSLSRSSPSMNITSNCFAQVNVTTGAIVASDSRFNTCRVTTDPALSRVVYVGELAFRSGESQGGAVSIEVRTTWTVRASWFDDTVGTSRDAVGTIDVVTTAFPRR